MKYFIVILLAVIFTNDLTRIAEVNKRKKSAKEAYEAGDYTRAISEYQYLIDSLGVAEDELTLNLGNAYFNMKDSVNARKHYSMLTSSEQNEIKSRAYQQLGVMDFAEKNYETALQNLKQSLKAEPTNEEARYNYELLKKVMQEQEEQQQEQQQDDQEQQEQENQENQENQQQQNQDQQQGEQDQQQQEQQQDGEQQEGEEQQDQEQQEQKEQEQQEGEQQEEEQEGEPKEDPMFDPEQLEELNISEDKAKMILEAMKNNEIQYIQQNKRKAKQPKKSGKPDW